MSADAWLTLAVLVVSVYALASERISPPFVLVAAMTLFLVTGVLNTDQALSGFGNPAPLTVAALYIVGAAVDATGALQRLIAAVLGRSESESRRRARLVSASAVGSGLLSNTAMTAIVAPGVVAWSRRRGDRIAPYLLPVCFAITLGGLLTLVGTTTNVVASGLLKEAGERPLGFFELTPVGAPIVCAGVLVLLLATSRLLPARRAPSEEAEADMREFTIEMVVARRLSHQSVASAGLRNLDGVFLVAIQRDERRVAPVAPEDILEEGDRLVFAGNVDRILDLQRLPGLDMADERHFTETGGGMQRRLYEVVIGETSRLSGTTLKEAGFRGRYGAAVLAIHRSGERLPSKLGEVRLRAADVLLVLADPQWRQRWRRSGDFLAIAPLDDELPPRSRNAAFVGLVVAALLVVVATGLLDLLPAALAAATVLVAGRVLAPDEARQAVDLNVIVVIAASFALAAAITDSGLGRHLAHVIVDALGGLGDIGPLAGILLATAVITQFVTNNAAAVVMFPIAMSTATAAGLYHRPFAIAVAVGASLSFVTPIGYQTNMMVYAMGGYRFGDFVRLGLPLLLVTSAVALVFIPLLWPLS